MKSYSMPFSLREWTFISRLARIGAGSPGHRQHRILPSRNGPLNRDLPVTEQQAPETFPGLANHCADAPAITLPTRFVFWAYHSFILKGQEVSRAVAGSAEIGNGISSGAFDDGQGLCGTRRVGRDGKSNGK